jgi:hypothetical protein
LAEKRNGGEERCCYRSVHANLLPTSYAEVRTSALRRTLRT